MNGIHYIIIQILCNSWQAPLTDTLFYKESSSSTTAAVVSYQESYGTLIL